MEIRKGAGEAAAYANLGVAYKSLGDYRKAIEYHVKYVKIAIEIGDRAGGGKAYRNLVNAYHLQSDFPKAIKYPAGTGF